MPGNVANYLTEWECLTSDPVVLGYVSGYQIEFDDFPVQNAIPNAYKQSVKQKSVLQLQIDELIDRNVVSKVDYCPEMFISNVFGREKQNGDIRMIIDLSDVNEYVKKFHFKMDHLDVVLDLVDEGVFMSSIDLKDAYYSIPIWEGHKQFLVFQWDDSLYQFNVLPFGLSSAPRIFTKVLKPIFSKMREEGLCVLGYIDDSLILGRSYEECVVATTRLSQLFESLGFTINVKKSSFEPSQQLTFLGYIIDSTQMTISPTTKKKEKLKEIIRILLSGENKFRIRFVASAIGFIVDLCKGVQYGPNYFRCLERDKILALKRVKDKGYDGLMFLSSESKAELRWWMDNIGDGSKKIRISQPSLVVTTDASLAGWGATFNGNEAGGRWAQEEEGEHINVLELRAILLAIQSFFKDKDSLEVLIKSDNTTAVSYVNKMGGSRSNECESVASEIWKFCEKRDMWLTATHIPGDSNEEADFISRHFTDNTEWTLNQHIFEKICESWGFPDVDLFASRLNFKVDAYVSWGKDPLAMDSDALTLDWDQWGLIYAFPPFSLISKCVRRIRRTSAMVILVVPDWPGQVWYPQLRKPLVKDLMRFPPREGNLIPSGPHLQRSILNKVPLKVVLC